MDITVEDREATGPHGSIPVRLYRPVSPTKTGLVWLHGGAFMFGDLDMPEADWVSRQLAARGIAVVSVFYRLAVGGVHYPVPGDDGLAAYRWAVEHRGELGVETFALGGASAGANLVAGIALRQRDDGLEPASGVVLAYPLLHSTLPEPSAELATKLLELPPQIQELNTRLGEIGMNYAGSIEVLDNPYAFPGNAELTGLPPFLIVNADMDILRPSGEAFASQLALAHDDVTIVREPGTMHGYLNQPENPSASVTLSRISRWLGGE
jgi:acetyl esterase